MGSKAMRQNVLHGCQMVRVGKTIEDFGCSFWCLLPLNLGAFKPQKTWPNNQDFAWPYSCKAQGVETPSWWVSQSSLLHDTVTAS